jgi:hypothetical protein
MKGKEVNRRLFVQGQGFPVDLTPRSSIKTVEIESKRFDHFTVGDLIDARARILRKLKDKGFAVEK